MTDATPLPFPGQTPLPILRDFDLSDIDSELAQFETDERARLGLTARTGYVEPMGGTFTKKERDKITLLVGGLTMAHDYLIEGALSRVGYRLEALDAPDNDALRVGKEFGNRGQCNPTYFTVGNLVKHLCYLRDEQGLSSEQIIADYVFLTAGACGPCRFGMYVTEYRKALRDAGFDGFRVVLFQQQGGLNQATGEESGLELTPKFFWALIKAVIVGDVINGLAYRVRPFEREAGHTDRVVAAAKRCCYDALAQGRPILLAMNDVRRMFAEIPVDRTQVKPKVAVIGEFWAMTTEGDGNYRLQRFLEEEGCEVDIQLVTNWLLYNIWEVKTDFVTRAFIRRPDDSTLGTAKLSQRDVLGKRVGLWAADLALRGLFQLFAYSGGFTGYHLPDVAELAVIAKGYMSDQLRGGEAHMEVGKLMLNVMRSKANLTLSVKPFGCMPSSGVSDGVQSLVTERFPGALFCAVETSGDGAANFYSRVQMYLFKARQAVQRELDRALQETGLSLEEVQGYLAGHPRLAGSLFQPRHTVSSTPANMVFEVADRLRNGSVRRVARGLLKAGMRGGVKMRDVPAVARRAGVGSWRLAQELGGIAKERLTARA